MYIKNLLLNYILYKQLNWYGHVRRMNEERLVLIILEWCPLVRRRRRRIRRKGRSRNSWMQEVTMREKRIDNKKSIDREEWRRKIKL